MAAKTDFSADEWGLLLESALLAGIAVTAAEPSGLWGMLRESMATAGAMRAARTDTNALISEVVAELETNEGRARAQDSLKMRFSDSKAPAIKAGAIEGLRDVAMLLDRRAPQDAPAFKSWLEQIGREAAEASKEGGFLGFGGVAVSDTEKATLAEISSALGSAPAA
ncbi:MAG TPA: hypothetical protein PK177_05870 [Burkholderiaceae bacterium]|nr:hypothetical protein [Burkholderiaceae bacterium]